MSEDCICGHKAEEHSRTGECGLCACACYEAKSYEQRRQVLGESESIYPLVREIRRLAERRTVECRHHNEEREDCPKCGSSGRLPDPAFAGLLDVVREQCFHDYHNCTTLDWFPPKDCPKCLGTSFATRKWEGMPRGALAGALYHGMRLIHFEHPSFATSDFGKDWWDTMRTDNPDPAACQLVIAFLKELP